MEKYITPPTYSIEKANKLESTGKLTYLISAEQSALDVLATPLPEVGRPAEDWRPLAQIVAEARYRGKDMAEDRIVPLAEAFDRSERKLVTELGQAAYLRKRVLPPGQGKITT